ncbi:hypothetical protein PVW53_05670 [Seohaeicola sp. SP36]|uniref:DUF6538 domain-containing protein n=1 Tax=unclassified Seohaeicola TaxID=2641111 RepID=UPI00237ACE0D|nr:MULTISPECIES: DUF6538 domain-containing protein [unclassified Seohaeicola]MDD9706764.1 hypothetical protein [Seohaeicola sp. 4SK31]MDD9735000.1 hypothetical protein [Seohaeicola sp. SP36]
MTLPTALPHAILHPASGAETVAGLNKRKGTYHLRMRIPARYAAIWAADDKPPTEIHRSLKTGDEREAKSRAAVVERMILAELDEKLSAAEIRAELTAAPGKSVTKMSHYQAIAAMTAARGFTYRTAQELATADDKSAEIVSRIKSLKDAGDAPTSLEAAALIGGYERPKETLMSAAEGMAERFPLEVRDKNEKQQKVWKARWTRPASKVKELLGGDPILSEITRADAVSLRDALQDRVLEGDMKGESAQKELQNLNLLWNKYHKSQGYDVIDIPPSPFRTLGDGMARLDEDGQKLEVPHDVLLKLIQPGALNGTNDEVRDIILVLIETGGRQSEITDIPPHAIHLDAPIPHLDIKREKGSFAREIKNAASKRLIPLTGVALEAMRRHPEGFPRYRGKGTFSAAANAFLRENDILPEGITIGGLRHSFDKRLDKANVKNEHVAQLMGHSRKKIRGREVYGDSLTLEERLHYHRLIELKPQRALSSPALFALPSR